MQYNNLIFNDNESYFYLKIYRLTINKCQILKFSIEISPNLFLIYLKMSKELLSDTSSIESWKSLSKRPDCGYLTKYPTNKLVSNLYPVRINEDVRIGIYSVKISPIIPYDSTKLANGILTSAKSKIEMEIGSSFGFYI